MDAFSNDRVMITMWLFSGMRFWSLTVLLKGINMELSSLLCCLSATQWTSSFFMFFKIQVIHELLSSALLSEKFWLLIFYIKVQLNSWGAALLHAAKGDRSQCWITAVDMFHTRVLQDLCWINSIILNLPGFKVL